MTSPPVLYGGNMASADMPFVAIVGGFYQADPATAAAAKAAAREIGKELAKAGFGLVVYFSDDKSLEPHVVAGYSAALTDGTGAIRVRYAESQRGQVKFNEETARPELFEHRLFPSQDWETPFYRSLAEEEGVDAVLLLGGATSTLITGQIAVARRLPILAVDEFGGAAAKVWNQLAQVCPEKHPSWGTRPAAAFVAQLKSDCAELAARHEEARRREQAFVTITSQRHQTLYATGSYIILLVALFFGIVYTS